MLSDIFKLKQAKKPKAKGEHLKCTRCETNPVRYRGLCRVCMEDLLREAAQAAQELLRAREAEQRHAPPKPTPSARPSVRASRARPRRGG